MQTWGFVNVSIFPKKKATVRKHILPSCAKAGCTVYSRIKYFVQYTNYMNHLTYTQQLQLNSVV